jgi:phosphoglycolate phosphatase-like HAD superfamily hydrolase
MQIGFDLDGFLYDSLEISRDVMNEIRKEMDYDPVTVADFRAQFQSRDWVALHLAWGMRKEDVGQYEDLYNARHNGDELPDFIEGGSNLLHAAVDAVGLDRFWIITNEPAINVRKRFVRDGLLAYVSRVLNPYADKSDTFHDLAMRQPDVPFRYVGDTISDGQAILAARERGAANLEFYGITHSYAWNTAEAMSAFCDEHAFAHTVGTLAEVPIMWNGH